MSKIITDVSTELIRDHDEENMTFRKTQHIPKEFLDMNRAQREGSLGQGENEYMSVARIPVAVHEKWLREGFDLMKEDAKTILMRLKQENLEAFITTKKQV